MNVIQLKRVNEGKPWSEMDVADLRNSLSRGNPMWLVADFLQRNEHEVRGKMAELGVEELPPLERAAALCDQLEAYNFEGEAGPLKNCIDWQELRRIITGTRIVVASRDVHSS